MMITSELSRVFSSMGREEQIRALCELTSFVTRASRDVLNMNMFDNYNHRTLQVYDCLSKHVMVERLVMNTRRTGKDAWCDAFSNIEIKTSKGKYPNYLFDKQNNEIRRGQIYEYDAFAFANFEDEMLVKCMFVHEPDAVGQIREMFSKKQSDFMHKTEQDTLRGKRGYDTIGITNKELNKIVHDVYTSTNGGWNIAQNPL